MVNAKSSKSGPDGALGSRDGVGADVENERREDTTVGKIGGLGDVNRAGARGGGERTDEDQTEETESQMHGSSEMSCVV